MTFFPIPVENFGGLDLVNDPGEIGFGGAIDLLNVDSDKPGRIRSRDGYTKFTALEGTNRYDSLFSANIANASGDIYAGAGTRVERLDATGAVANVTTASTASPHYFTALGTPSGSFVYIANGTDNVFRYNNTAPGFERAPADFTFTGTTPTGKFLAVTPWDNRLVSAGGSTGSRVRFSDAGVPTTFGANNYIDLTPGDGEVIQGTIAWRDLLFVFKETKFFIFYGTSTDSSGNPIFNYRSVLTGIGLGSPQAVAVAPDALYFFARQGIYRTTGGPPVSVSGPLLPLFKGTVPAFYSGGKINLVPSVASRRVSLAWLNGRLYVALPTGVSSTNDSIFVLDQGWSLWTPANGANALVTSTCANSPYEELYVAYASGLKHIGRMSATSAATTDDGTTITSRYQSGFENMAPPRRYIDRYGFGPSRKRVRSWRVAGTGTVTMAVAADMGATVGSTALTLGVSPAIAETRYSRAIRGSKISYKLSGTVPWSVNDLVGFLADTRESGSNVSD